MREKYIEQKLVREVKKRGGLCEKWNSGSSGWPDRIILLPVILCQEKVQIKNDFFPSCQHT